jgi:hypothetical protein
MVKKTEQRRKKRPKKLAHSEKHLQKTKSHQFKIVRESSLITDKLCVQEKDESM